MDMTTEDGYCHPPAVFSIGADRGFLVYAGQPQACRKCGSTGHNADNCEQVRCRSCGKNGHITRDCKEPRRCHLCETIEHVLWGCKYANKVWAGMKRRYKGLEALTYEEITYLRPKDKKKEENKIRCMLLSITKLKIWRARQGYIRGGYEWKEMGTIKDIEREFEGIYRHELQRWGIDTIKDRWKDYYE
uniref:CCHC-type domain-containing protein n=1 Tax=Astatotilapia calliptera TaxID=8154 RepID=A0AAX7TMQ6_ASTCA